jgi:hypothetical protein
LDVLLPHIPQVRDLPSLEENTNTEMPGKVMDRDYHLVAKVHGLTVDKVKGMTCPNYLLRRRG